MELEIITLFCLIIILLEKIKASFNKLSDLSAFTLFLLS